MLPVAVCSSSLTTPVAFASWPTLASDLKWAQALHAGPQALRALGQVLLLARTVEDFELDTPSTGHQFKYLQWYRFRLALFEVVLELRDVFALANANMGAVSHASAAILGLIEELRRQIRRPDPDANALRSVVDDLRRHSILCIEKSLEVKQRFDASIGKLNELLQACLSTDSSYGEKRRNNELRLAELESTRQSQEAINETNRQIAESMRQQVDDAKRLLHEAEAAIDSLPEAVRAIMAIIPNPFADQAREKLHEAIKLRMTELTRAQELYEESSTKLASTINETESIKADDAHLTKMTGDLERAIGFLAQLGEHWHSCAAYAREFHQLIELASFSADSLIHRLQGPSTQEGRTMSVAYDTHGIENAAGDALKQQVVVHLMATLYKDISSPHLMRLVNLLNSMIAVSLDDQERFEGMMADLDNQCGAVQEAIQACLEEQEARYTAAVGHIVEMGTEAPCIFL